MKNKISKKKKIVIGIIAVPILIVLILKITSGFIDYKELISDILDKTVNYKESLAVDRNKDTKSTDSALQISKNISDDFNKSYIINILFLGLDVTEDSPDRKALHRTDAIALIRINLNTKEVKVLSIPRDTYAYVPIENKNDKINHAYAFGSIYGDGIGASVDAVNQFVKYSPVDYYFTFNLEPIPEIVDEIGGVKLDVEIDMKSHDANVSKGLQVLNGQQVYDYIHWRYSGDGDIGRIKRQQKFLTALFNQLKEDGKLMDMVKLVLTYREDVQTDMTLRQMLALGNFANKISNENITYYIVPGDGEMINNISYWVPYETETDELLKSFFSEEANETDK